MKTQALYCRLWFSFQGASLFQFQVWTFEELSLLHPHHPANLHIRLYHLQNRSHLFRSNFYQAYESLLHFPLHPLNLPYPLLQSKLQPLLQAFLYLQAPLYHQALLYHKFLHKPSFLPLQASTNLPHHQTYH